MRSDEYPEIDGEVSTGSDAVLKGRYLTFVQTTELAKLSKSESPKLSSEIKFSAYL